MNHYNLTSNNSLTQNSSGGKLLKWRIGNKFIKTSTLDQTQLAPVFLYESYAEVIAYKIAKYLGFNSIQYKLCSITIDDRINTIACECEDFRDKGEQYISIGKLILEGRIRRLSGYGSEDDYRTLIDQLSIVEESPRKKIDTIILLDSLILNDDRHYGNLGIVQDIAGNIRIAPIFDNGNSLFCHKHTEQLGGYKNDLIQYLRCKPFSTDFNRQLGLIDQSTKREIANKTKGLQRHINKSLVYMANNQYLPANRALFIQELLKERVNYIFDSGG